MKKNKYTTQGFSIFKNDVLFSKIEFIGGPTGNCQVSSISNINNIYVLDLNQIKKLIKSLVRYSSKQVLFNITDKRAIKKFDKYLETNKIDVKLKLKNDVCISYLILKYNLLK